MIIKWVKLRNIRSYVSGTIEFPEGSILLSGDIGAGKSSILHAMEFALFGFTNEISGETLLRNGKQSGSVEFCFTIDGKEIIIKRNLQKKNSSFSQASGYAIVNGVKTEKSAEELKAFVLELLGYPQEFLKKKLISLYRYTVYTPQEEMKRILFESREDRLNTLRKIFGIEKYGLIRANTMIVAGSIREKFREYSAKIEDLDVKKEELSEKKKEFSELKEKISKLLPEIEKIKEKTEKLKKERQSAEEKRNRFAELKNQLSSSEAMLSEKVGQIENFKSQIESNEKEIRIIEKKISELKIIVSEIDEAAVEKKLNDAQKNLSSFEKLHAESAERKRMLAVRKKEVEEELKKQKEVSEELPKKEDELANLLKVLEERENAEKKKQELELELKKLIEDEKEFSISEKDSSKVIDEITKYKICPLCKQEIKEDYKEHIMKEQREKTEKAKKQLNEINAKRKELNSELKELNEKIQKIIGAEIKSEKLKFEIKALKESSAELLKKDKQLASISSQIEILEKQIPSEEKISMLKSEEENLKNLLKECHENSLKAKERENLANILSEKNKSLKNVEEQISALKKSIGAINKAKIEAEEKLKALGEPETDYKKLSEELEALQKSQKELELSKAYSESESSMLKQALEKIEKEVAEKSKIKEKADFLKNLNEMFTEKFVNLVSLIEKNVMRSVHYEFSRLFEEWFGALVEEETMSSRLDEDFTPVIEQNGYETGVENLSGGEKTAVALAYRLALNRVINDMVADIKTRDIIILDEPTDGFSSEQLDKIRNVLDDLNAKQTIIVSHEAKIESFVNHIIRIVKQEHVSRVVT